MKQPNPPRAPSAISRLAPLKPLDREGVCGVYFLCLGDEVVYVGSSINVPARVAQHAKDKTYDRVYMLPVPRESLRDTEGAFIRMLRPKGNGSTGTPTGSRPDGEILAPILTANTEKKEQPRFRSGGERLLRTPEVLSRTGMGRTTLWRKARDGSFPQPRQITGNTIGWLESEVEAWLAGLEIADAPRSNNLLRIHR